MSPFHQHRDRKKIKRQQFNKNAIYSVLLAHDRVCVCVCVCLSLNAHPRHHTYSSTTLKLHSCDRSFALRISFFSHYLSLHIFGYLIFCLTLPRCLQAHGLNYCHFQLDATRYRGFASLLWCMIWYDTIVYVYTLKCASAFAVLL